MGRSEKKREKIIKNLFLIAFLLVFFGPIWAMNRNKNILKIIKTMIEIISHLRFCIQF